MVQRDCEGGRAEWDGVREEKGADHAEPGSQLRVRSRVRWHRAVVQTDHRKWGQVV